MGDWLVLLLQKVPVPIFAGPVTTVSAAARESGTGTVCLASNGASPGFPPT